MSSLKGNLHRFATGTPLARVIISRTGSLVSRVTGSSGTEAVVTTTIASVMVGKARGAPAPLPPLWQLAGNNYGYVCLGGLSCASAVIVGVIGTYFLRFVHDDGETKADFELANRFHFLHSMALMAIPITKRPLLTGTLMLGGCMLFSGAVYYRIFTGDKRFDFIADPLGSATLLAAWFSLWF